MELARVRSAMPKVWRVFCKTVLWGLGLVVALIAIVVAINAFDEDLSSKAQQLLNAPPNLWKPEENLYLAMVGFDAMPGQSPIAVGEMRVSDYDKEAKSLSTDPLATIAPDKQDQVLRLKFVGKMDFCDPLGASCWTGMEGHKEEINGLLNANQVLYQRYLDLPRSSGYYETTAPSIYTPAAHPGEIRWLFLANIALRLKTANSTQQRRDALGDLYSDIAIWRMMLIGEGSLASKMVATVSLHGDFALLADLIADANVDTETIDHEVEAILGQVEDNDWKLHGIFPHEFRATAAFLEPLRHNKTYPWLLSSGDARHRQWWESYSAPIQGYLFKIGATENLSAENTFELQRVADSDAGDFLAARDAYHSWAKDTFEFGPKYVYNPIGRATVGIAAEAYIEFLLRAHDVGAFVRLVRLDYEVRRQKIRPEDIAPFMEAHRHLATHPVDGKLFTWDASKREMAIQPLAPPRYERRFKVPIWTAVAP